MRLTVIVAAWSVLLVSVATGCASFDEWQRKAIFQHNASQYWTTPNAPLSAEAFDLPLANGDKVHAWYLTAGVKNAPTILFLHGARRNLNGNVYRLERWRDLGFNVLAIDYRGFGRSTHIVPSEASALEDAGAAFAELVRREPDASRRFIYGYSLGGALAIALAAEVDGIAGVVVESSFTSISDLVRTSKWGWVPGLTWLVTQNFDSLTRISRVNEPLLFLHGTQDTLVPHTMSDRLLSAAINVPQEFKRVLKIEGARHHGAMALAAEELGRTMKEFTREAAAFAAAGGAGAAGVAATVR